MIGSKLGHYEVVAELGRGGMGQVFRAHDPNLRRDVALKILPPEFTADAERVGRFEREARTLATLQHPNIASVYGFEEHAGRRFLVMELVEGEDLETRITRGPVPVDEALSLATQIASGLEAAHEQGVVHRDLKPANVRVTADGTPKILDFGLAKAWLPDPASGSGDLSASPTVTSLGTQAGVILGTAAYMSPEQARGRLVDRRADIWSFGCVLYEMLVGRAPFAGDTVTDLLAEIVKTEPDLENLPADTPAAVRGLIGRCLQKDPGLRLRDIGEARLLLQDPTHDLWSGGTAEAKSTSRARGWILAAVGLALGVVLGAVLVPTLLRPDHTAPTAPAKPLRFFIQPQPRAPMATVWPDVAVSASGDALVYVTSDNELGVFQGTNSMLAMRWMDRLESVPLPETSGAVAPFLSPDGASIAYWSFLEQRLERIATDGGNATTLVDPVPSLRGGCWTDAGTILFADGEGLLYEVPATGGEATIVARADPEAGELGFRRPIAVSGTRTVIAGVLTGGERGRVVALDLDSGTRRTLAEGDVPLGITARGHLVYHRGQDVMLQPMRPGTLEPEGTGLTLLEGVSDDVTLSREGTLIYRPGEAGDQRTGRLVWIDPAGQVTTGIEDTLVYPRYPRIDPDGRRVAFTAGPGGAGKIWIYDLQGRRPPYNLTFDEHSVFPTWSPDGRRIAFFGPRNMAGGRVYTIAADGSELEPSPMSEEMSRWTTSAWTSRDTLIAATGETGAEDIVELPLSAGGAPVELIATSFPEQMPALSPDERWIAYESDRSGRTEVWVQPYPSGAPLRVSTSGGGEPCWSRDGNELYFQSGRALMAARVATTEPELRFEPARELFRDLFVPQSPFTPRSYDVHPDGRFLMIQSVTDRESHPGFVVVHNWFAEVDALVER